MSRVKRIYFAQKAIVFDKKQDKIFLLLTKYEKAPLKDTCKVESKYGCPGGKIDFGEELDASLVRECLEETGITVIPEDPVDTITWFVEKPKEISQIIAVYRLCRYKNGKPKGPVTENETSLAKSEWVDISRFNVIEKLIENEIEPVKKALKLFSKIYEINTKR